MSQLHVVAIQVPVLQYLSDKPQQFFQLLKRSLKGGKQMEAWLLQ
jgi:hypothetical protein